MKKLLALLVLVGIGLTVFMYSRFTTAIQYAKDPMSPARIIVDIKPGYTGAQIAQTLYEDDLILSPQAFEFYLKQQGLTNKLQAGRMVFQENQTLPEIVDVLMSGKSEEMAVTLLEGWTARQIGNYLEELGMTTAESFMECIESCTFEYDFLPGYLEGYLYPDTYFVDPVAYTDEKFISRLINTLDNKLTAEDRYAIQQSDYTFEDIMIMASIVEREERNDAEKATVAGILWNRYDIGMGLGADATVLYALGRTSGGLSYQDLQVDSPYNTRKYAGLPPTPIANPSIESVRATIYAEDTPYWYYLHDPEGGIHYAETLEGHNANKVNHL